MLLFRTEKECGCISMKKLVFFSYIASPHQVRFQPYLQKYYDSYFFFYEELGDRQKWWRVDLGDRCKVLNCWFKWRCKYVTFLPFRYLWRIKPDIVMLGGFSIPANYLCYLWARWHGCKTVVLTERSRDRTGKLRKYDLIWRIIHFLYRKVDLVICMGPDFVSQFRDEFHFGDKVAAGRYPCDCDKYFKHRQRLKKEAYTLIYANRMVDIYDPLMAIDIFVGVLKRHPKTKLKINASGVLRPQVEAAIDRYGIRTSVEFLDHIQHWDDLDQIYQACDIMYLPAKFSNGNYTLVEAMCSGMGIVISDKVRGVRARILKERETGFVVPHEVQPFVEKICWIIEHPEFFDRVTSINRETTKPLTMEVTASLYNRLIGN